MSDRKLGLFICDCGEQIASILDMESLEQGARDLPGVACVQRLRYSCSPDGLDAIVSATREGGLDRVLVAGCTARMQERHFRDACNKAGLDGNLVELVDIREGCAWVHQGEPQAATAKALDLIRMGAARAALNQPRQPARAEVVPGALVIGGGVAGMAAALTLATAGQQVTLIEREAALGGMMRDVPAGTPDRRNGNGKGLAQQIEAVTSHPRIDLLLGSEVTGIAGTVGRYSISVDGADKHFDVGAIVVATGAQALQPRDGASVRNDGGRVVLATPLVPQPDASVVAHTLGIKQDQNGFFPEVRYRLRPEGYAERGIYVCGSAHHPVDQSEAEFQAIGAALKALRHLRAGQVANAAPVAVVDAALCTGCAHCVAPCPFGAITMQQRAEAVDLAQIDPLLCTGCGNCVVVCPVKAIGQPVDSDAQVLAQIEAALATHTGRPRVLVFGCEWSGHAAAELAGATRLSYPVDTRLIRLRCSARFDPIHILWALLNGADGVFLGACALGDCHYVDGNRYAQERIVTLRDLLAKNGFDPRRLRLEWIVPDDPHDFVKKVSDFTDLVKKL